jgi:crotonobetainyl-CoA:carnitine CoA-transferase CaiB-like acyl-CoA transferase
VADRVHHRAELVPVVADILLQRTMAEWIALLEPANVPCGPIYGLDQVFEHPQVKHRGLKSTLAHAAGAQAPNVLNPIRLSDTPVRYSSAAPLLGQHTDDVLQRLAGLAPGDIEALRARKVL